MIYTARFCIFILLLTQAFAVFASSAQVYVWRNEQGVPVFSDSAKPGAVKLDIKEPTTVKSSIDTSILDIKPKAINNNYQVEIIQPEDKATIRSNIGSAYVTGQINSIVKPGLTIQLYLDDKPYKKPQTHSTFILRNIDRGEHQIKMALLNDKGKVIATSSTVTFYMHRTSVNKVN